MESILKNNTQTSGFSQPKSLKPPLQIQQDQRHSLTQNNFQQIKGILKNKTPSQRPLSVSYKKQKKQDSINRLHQGKSMLTQTLSSFSLKEAPKLDPQQMIVPIKRTHSSSSKQREKIQTLMKLQRSQSQNLLSQHQAMERKGCSKHYASKNKDSSIIEDLQLQNSSAQIQIMKLNDNMRKKLRRDLDQAKNEVKAKKELLVKLKNDLKSIQQQIEREGKFDKISKAHDEELIRKLSVYDSKKTVNPYTPENFSSCYQPQKPSEIHTADPEQLSDDHDEHCTEKGEDTESKAAHYHRHLRQEQERQAEERRRKYEEIDIDVGIANQEFQPSKLLEWKRKLIDLMDESKFNQEKEKLDQLSLKYMLERLEGQQGYEIAMIRELDPYFDFQTKIYPTLQGISQGKESRKKLQDQKIFQMKKQLRDKKSQQTAFLRQRCNELAELERDNKKMKSKMLGGGASPGPTSTNKDTSSVAGSLAGKSKPIDSMSGLELKKKTEEGSNAPKVEKQPVEQNDEPQIVPKDLEITINNCLDINHFLYTIEALEQFQEFDQEILKLEDNDLDDEDDEVFVQALVKEVKQKRVKALKVKSKQMEKILQLKAVLSQKPPKIGVHFQQKMKQQNHQSHEKQASQDKKKAQVEQYLERQQEAQMIFYDLKEKVEQIIYLPDILLKERDHLPRDNEDIELDKQSKSNLKDLDKDPETLNEQKANADTLNIEIPSIKMQEEKPNEIQKHQTLSIVHSQKQEQENSKIELYKLLEQIRQDPEQFAGIYNDKMAADAILQIDMKELNENTVRQEEMLDDLNEELEQQKLNLEINRQNNIDDRTYEEKLNTEKLELNNIDNIKDEDRKREVEEKNLIQSKLSKFQQSKGDNKKKQSHLYPEGFPVKDRAKIRQVQSKDEILGSLITNQYNAEQMFTDHIHFRKLTKETRQIVDKIRLQCIECTNAFAYRIYAVLDAADIDYPDGEIEKILKHYQRFWPYEPLDLDTQKDYGYNTPAVVSSASILKKLNQDEEDKKKAEEKKKQARKNKRMKVDKGLTDFQKKFMDSGLWIAFQHKMEIKLLFLHQKKFIIFVTQQIQIYRQPHALQKVAMLGGFGGITNKTKLVNPVRKVLSIDEFSDEYKHFMKANPWNLHEAQKIDAGDEETAEEAVVNQQLQIMDDKHFFDTYMKIHVVKSQIEKNKIKAAQRAQMQKYQKYYSSQVKESLVQNNSGAQRIQRLVNDDKCNYSKLSQYNIQDSDFNQEFLTRANDVYKSQLFQIPEEGFGGNSKSNRAASQGGSRPNGEKKNYLKQTQSKNQKGKDQSKIPTICPSKPTGSKPPLKLNPIIKLAKSSSASNIKTSTVFYGPSALKERPRLGQKSKRARNAQSLKNLLEATSSPYSKMNKFMFDKMNSTTRNSDSNLNKATDLINADLAKDQNLLTHSADFQNTQNWYFAASELEPEQQAIAIHNQDQFYNTIFEPQRGSLGAIPGNAPMADYQMRSAIHTSTMFNTIPSVLSNNLPDDSATSQTTNTNRKIKIKKIKLPSIKDNKDLNKILKKM